MARVRRPGHARRRASPATSVVAHAVSRPLLLRRTPLERRPHLPHRVVEGVGQLAERCDQAFVGETRFCLLDQTITACREHHVASTTPRCGTKPGTAEPTHGVRWAGTERLRVGVQAWHDRYGA